MFGLPRKTRWESWSWYLYDCFQIITDNIFGKIQCLIGEHDVKFGTAPYCYRCGRRP